MSVSERMVGNIPSAPWQREALARVLASEIDSDLAAQAWALIAPAQRILMLAHEHPDCDTIGSALALGHALTPYGKEWLVACADPVPANFAFLPGYERVVTTLPDERFDLVVALDAGELSRYGAIYDRHKAFLDHATILNIDHHVTSAGCGQVNIIDPRFAATAELLTVFLLCSAVTIGRDAAVCLLAGIITDTRSFEFDATTESTLTAGAYLVACGAVPEQIIKPIYRLKPLAKVRLWGLVLPTVCSTADGRLVWAVLRRDFVAEAGATADMDEGLSSYLIDVEGAALAALFKEQPDGTTRVSLRSVHPYDAAAMASHFGGGGHVRAAGCTLPLALDAAVAELVPYLSAAIGAAWSDHA